MLSEEPLSCTHRKTAREQSWYCAHFLPQKYFHSGVRHGCCRGLDDHGGLGELSHKLGAASKMRMMFVVNLTNACMHRCTVALLHNCIATAGNIVCTAQVRAALPNTEFTILSAPPPGSGAILAGILGLVERNTFQTELKPAQIRWAATIQVQWIEGLPSPGIASLRWIDCVSLSDDIFRGQACKFAYARRTLMGDWNHAESEGLKEQVSLNTLWEGCTKTTEKRHLPLKGGYLACY